MVAGHAVQSFAGPTEMRWGGRRPGSRAAAVEVVISMTHQRLEAVVFEL